VAGGELGRSVIGDLGLPRVVPHQHYPADFQNTSDFAMAVSPRRAGDFQGRDKPFAVTYPLMLDHRRIWVFGTMPSTRRAPGLISDESMALERHFTLIDRHRFHGILVTLWLRR